MVAPAAAKRTSVPPSASARWSRTVAVTQCCEPTVFVAVPGASASDAGTGGDTGETKSTAASADGSPSSSALLRFPSAYAWNVSVDSKSAGPGTQSVAWPDAPVSRDVIWTSGPDTVKRTACASSGLPLTSRTVAVTQWPVPTGTVAVTGSSTSDAGTGAGTVKSRCATWEEPGSNESWSPSRFVSA